MRKIVLALAFVGIVFAGGVGAATEKTLYGFSGTVKGEGGVILDELAHVVLSESANGGAWNHVGTTQDVYDHKDGRYELPLSQEKCDQLRTENIDVLYLRVTTVQAKPFSQSVQVSELCSKEVQKLDIVLEMRTIDEVTSSGSLALVKMGGTDPISGCRVEGKYGEGFMKKKLEWIAFRKEHSISGYDIYVSGDDQRQIAVRAADVEKAEELWDKLTAASEISFSDLRVAECVTGAGSELTGILLRPKYQAGISRDGGLRGDASDLTHWLQRFGTKIAGAMAAIAVFFVVWNAFNLLIARGDADDISKAKKALTWIIFGLLITIFAYVLVKTVISLTYLW